MQENNRYVLSEITRNVVAVAAKYHKTCKSKYDFILQRQSCYKKLCRQILYKSPALRPGL